MLVSIHIRSATIPNARMTKTTTNIDVSLLRANLRSFLRNLENSRIRSSYVAGPTAGKGVFRLFIGIFQALYRREPGYGQSRCHS